MEKKMEGNYERTNTGYWTTPENERANRSQLREYNRDRNWTRPDYNYLQPTQRQNEYDPQYSRPRGTNPRNNRPLQNYYGQPPQWTPHPNFNQPQNRFGVGTATGYNYSQPRSLFDTYNEAQQNMERRSDWRSPPNYDPNFENPQQRGHYGNEYRRDSNGSDNQMKRKEYGNKEQKETQNQSVKRRSTMDPGTMVSPLEGLYQFEDIPPKGRGYGVQRFRFTRFDGNTRRREGNRNKTGEKWEAHEESTDTNKTGGSKSSKAEDEPDRATAHNKDDQKTSPEGEEPKERVTTWNKIDTIVGRNTGVNFGFYQEIPKGSNNDSNTGRRADEGWHALEERRDTDRASGNMSQDRSPQADQRMVSPEQSRNWNRFDRNVNRRMGGTYGYYGNRSTRNTYDYNTRRNAREDWYSPEQFNSIYRPWSYNRGRNQYPRGRGLYRSNYNRNITRRVKDWDAPEETTDANKTNTKIPDWDEPKETATKVEDDKNVTPKDDEDKPDEKLESTSNANDDKKTGGQEEDDEEARKQRERDRNFAALMRYIDEDWGPPQWPSRTTEKTDNEDENSDSPKEATSSEKNKEKTSSDPYDWLKNKKPKDRKTGVSRKSPDPIISKRSDSDEDSDADESPQEEMKSTGEKENSLSSWEHCECPKRRQNTNNDGDNSESHEGEGNNNSESSNASKNSESHDGKGNDSDNSNDSESSNTSPNTNDSSEDNSGSSRGEETESGENLESSKERETSTDSNADENNERAEQFEDTDLEGNATGSSSNVQNQISGNDDGGERGRELSPVTNIIEKAHDIVNACVVTLLKGGEEEVSKTHARHLRSMYNADNYLKEMLDQALTYGWQNVLRELEQEDNYRETPVDSRYPSADSDETTDDDKTDEEDEDSPIPPNGFNRIIPVPRKQNTSPKASMTRIHPTKNRNKAQKNFGRSMSYFGDSEDNSEEDTDIETMDEQEEHENSCKDDLEKPRQDLRNLAMKKKRMEENGEKEPVVSLDPQSVVREIEMTKAWVQKKFSQDSDIEQPEPNTVTGPEYDSQDTDMEPGSAQKRCSTKIEDDDTNSNDEKSAREKEEELRAKRRREIFGQLCKSVLSSSHDTDSDDESQLNCVDGTDSSTTGTNKSDVEDCGSRRKATPGKRRNKHWKRQSTLCSRFNGNVSKFKKQTYKRGNRKQEKKNDPNTQGKNMWSSVKKDPTKVTGRTKKQLKACNPLNYSLEEPKVEHKCKICSTTTDDIAAHYKSAHPESQLLTPTVNRREATATVVQNTAEEVEEVAQASAESTTYSTKMCQTDTTMNFHDFFMHIAAKTGEYMATCAMEDNTTSAADEDISTQIMNQHPSYDLNTFEDTYEPFPNTPGFEPLYGFICSKCNFVQVFRKDVEDHVKKTHKGDESIAIIKVNLSEVPPDQTDDIETTGCITDEEDVTQAEPQGVDSVVTTDADTVRVEENKGESEAENHEDNPTNPDIEKDEQAVNDNETSTPIYPSSSERLQVQTNDEYDDHMEFKVESEVKPAPYLTRVSGCLGVVNWDSSPFLYNCFDKNCMFTTITYSDLERHIRNIHLMEEDSDSYDEQIGAEDDNMMISDTLENLTADIEPRMTETEINNEGLLPENYNDEREPPKQDPNNNSEQNYGTENNPQLVIFEGMPEYSNFLYYPLYIPYTPMEIKFQQVNDPVGIEEEPGSNYDLEEHSNTDDAASHTPHDIWGLTPVAGSTLDEEQEMDALLESGITHDDNNKNEMERPNPELQRAIRTSVIVSPKKKIEPQNSTKEKRKFKKPPKKDKKFINGLTGCDLYKCGNMECSFSAYEQQTLMNHMLVCAHARQNGRLSCPHCQRIFWYRNFFLIHLQHHGKNVHFCKMCGFGSPVKASLAKHMNLKHKSLRTKSPSHKKAATKNTNIRTSTTQTLDNPNQHTPGFCEAPLPNTYQEPSTSNQHLLNTAQFHPDFNQDPVNTYQGRSIPHQIIPNTNQRPNDLWHNPQAVREEFHDINPFNTNQQPQTSAKPKTRRRNNARVPRVKSGQSEAMTQESGQPPDELCCPLCRERFSVKMITLYQYHLYEEVRHRRMMNILTKAKLNGNNTGREKSPDLESKEPILVTSEPDKTEIMFWVNKNIKRQLYQLRQIRQKKTRP